MRLSCRLSCLLAFGLLAHHALPAQCLKLQAADGAPVAFASITWQDGQVGIVSNIDGLAPLDARLVDSLLHIQALGFVDTFVTLRAEHLADTFTLALRPRTYALPLATVVPAYRVQLCKAKRGYALSIPVMFHYFWKIMASTFTPYDGLAFFKSIAIHFKKVHPNDSNIYRLRILEQDEAGQYTIDVLQESLLFEKKKGWSAIDLEAYRIPVPNKPFMIGLEIQGTIVPQPNPLIETDFTKISTGYNMAWPKSDAYHKGRYASEIHTSHRFFTGPSIAFQIELLLPEE